jgi:hypothetical protein
MFLSCAMFRRGCPDVRAQAGASPWIDLKSERTQEIAFFKDSGFQELRRSGAFAVRSAAWSGEGGVVAAALRSDRHGNQRCGRAEGVCVASENRTNPRDRVHSMSWLFSGCENAPGAGLSRCRSEAAREPILAAAVLATFHAGAERTQRQTTFSLTQLAGPPAAPRARAGAAAAAAGAGACARAAVHASWKWSARWRAMRSAARPSQRGGMRPRLPPVARISSTAARIAAGSVPTT